MDGYFYHYEMAVIHVSGTDGCFDHPLNPSRTESYIRSPHRFGETATGRIIAVVYEEIDEDTVYPITAYEVEL